MLVPQDDEILSKIEPVGTFTQTSDEQTHNML